MKVSYCTGALLTLSLIGTTYGMDHVNKKARLELEQPAKKDACQIGLKLIAAVQAGDIGHAAALIDHAIEYSFYLSVQDVVNIQDESGRTALDWALRAQNNVLIKLLLDNKAGVGQGQSSGKTSLMGAVIGGNRAQVKLLIETEGNLNAQDAQGKTALMHAVAQGDAELVKLLKDSGASVDIRDNAGATAYGIAHQLGFEDLAARVVPAEYTHHLDINFRYYVQSSSAKSDNEQASIQKIKEYLYAGAGLFKKDRYMGTILHAALKYNQGCQKMVQFIIEQLGSQNNAQFDQRDDQGYTPLHYAVMNRLTQTAKLLVAKGANCYATSKQGKTALDLARESNQEELVKLLEVPASAPALAGADSKQLSQDLFKAIAADGTERVGQLLALGADTHRRDDLYRTPLMNAVARAHEPTVTLLANHAQTDLGAVDKSKITALRLAVDSLRAPIVKVLLKAAQARGVAIIDIPDCFGNTPLRRLAGADNCVLNNNSTEMFDVLKVLIAAGADITIKGAKGKDTPLEAALKKHNEYIAKILLAAGSPLPTKMPSKYVTYCHDIFKKAMLRFPNRALKQTNPLEYDRALSVLRKAFSDLKDHAQEYSFLDFVDPLGNTVLHYAVLAGNKPMIILLLSLMARAQRAEAAVQRNNEGQTFVDIAVVKSPLNILPILSSFCQK